MNLLGAVFIIPFGHNGLNSTKAEVVAHDFVASSETKPSLSRKISSWRRRSRPKCSGKKFCDEFDNCVAINTDLSGLVQLMRKKPFTRASIGV